MERNKPLGFMQLAIIVGFSLFYAEYLTSFFGVFLSFPHGYGFTEQHAGQVVYFASSLLGAGVVLTLFRRRGKSEVRITAGPCAALALCDALLPSGVIVDALGLQLPLALVLAVCAVAGAGIAVGFVQWDDLAKRGYLNRNVFVHGIIFAAGGMLFVLASALLPQVMLGGVCLALLFASTWLLVFTGRRAEPASDAPVEPAVEFFRKTHHVDFSTNVVTIPFGFAFVLLYRYLGFSLLFIMGAAILLDLLFALTIGRTRIIPFMGALRISMAVVALACIALALPTTQAKTGALAAIVVIWFIYRTVNAGSLMELAAKKKLSLQYTVGRGKLSSNTGFCLGLVLGLAVMGLESAGQVIPYVALAAVALSVVTALFFLPFENESDMPGIRTLKPVKLTDLQAQLAQVAAASVEQKSDRQRCALIISRYKLSPREGEVLAYVVKGRNAKHVAEKLYISESTAKTHMSNIYRKTNVHSQQELLDVVEKL